MEGNRRSRQRLSRSVGNYRGVSKTVGERRRLAASVNGRRSAWIVTEGRQEISKSIEEQRRASESSGGYGKAAESIEDYRRVLESSKKYQRASKSIKEHQRVSKSIEEHRRALKSIEKYRRESERIGEHRRASESIGEHRRNTGQRRQYPCIKCLTAIKPLKCIKSQLYRYKDSVVKTSILIGSKVAQYIFGTAVGWHTFSSTGNYPPKTCQIVFRAYSKHAFFQRGTHGILLSSNYASLLRIYWVGILRYISLWRVVDQLIELDQQHES
jgi:hypothetical protein